MPFFTFLAVIGSEIEGGGKKETHPFAGSANFPTKFCVKYRLFINKCLITGPSVRCNR